MQDVIKGLSGATYAPMDTNPNTQDAQSIIRNISYQLQVLSTVISQIKHQPDGEVREGGKCSACGCNGTSCPKGE